MRKLVAIAATAATLVLASAAPATITIFTNADDFLAATTALGTDTFNDLAAGTALDASLTRTAGGYGYTVSDTATVLYGAGSAADGWLSNDTNAAQIVFNGFSGVSAIGGLFFGSDISGAFTSAPLGITVSATDTDGTVTQTLLSPTTTSFLGFVSTGAVSQLSVAATVPNSSYWATVNNLVLGQSAAVEAVPEPATWGLMVLGFGAVGASLRGRRSQAAIARA